MSYVNGCLHHVCELLYPDNTCHSKNNPSAPELSPRNILYRCCCFCCCNLSKWPPAAFLVPLFFSIRSEAVRRVQWPGKEGNVHGRRRAKLKISLMENKSLSLLLLPLLLLAFSLAAFRGFIEDLISDLEENMVMFRHIFHREKEMLSTDSPADGTREIGLARVTAYK